MSKPGEKIAPFFSVVIKGGGEMASGIAVRLYRAGFHRIVILEREIPLAVRRRVAFSEAIHNGEHIIENIRASRCATYEATQHAWSNGHIAVMVDPAWELLRHAAVDVSIDAVLAKRNIGTRITEAPLVIALGPGFTAGIDAHYVVETQRGHALGRVYTQGCAEADTGIPGDICGHTTARVLRAPVAGALASCREIGEMIARGDVVCRVGDTPVHAAVGGVLRGCLRSGTQVAEGVKLGDIDPRGRAEYCDTVSEKARALGGAVLEVVCAEFVRKTAAA